MPIKSYQVMDLELGGLVIDWGGVEEVKDVLLAEAQLFTSEHTLVVDNSDGRFSPYKAKSVFAGRSLQLARCLLRVDGIPLFDGLIRSVEPDPASRTAKITSQNAFAVPANKAIVLSAAAANPATVIRAILVQVGLAAYIDSASFASAGAGASAAGATITVSYAEGSRTTALAAIQSISSLCSLSCFVQGGLIRLRAFQPYQGDLAGVKYQVTAANAYDFGSLADAFNNLSNSVTITYGASLVTTLIDQASIKANRIEANTSFTAATGSSLAVPDITSAMYFGQLFLARAATLKRVGRFTAGPELVQVHIGDRITVSDPAWGSSIVAFEIIESHLTVASNSVELVCATI